jgi:hypothetical protein
MDWKQITNTYDIAQRPKIKTILEMIEATVGKFESGFAAEVNKLNDAPRAAVTPAAD